MPAVLAERPERLRQVACCDAVVESLVTFREAGLHCLRHRIGGRPILSDWKGLLTYLHSAMSYSGREVVRLLCLNSRHMLIRDEVISEGTFDRSAVYVREVLRRALELNAPAIILVHNHPSGDPSPSRSDIDLSKALIEAGKQLDIAVYDHLIISSSGHVSLRANGLI